MKNTYVLVFILIGISFFLGCANTSRLDVAEIETTANPGDQIAKFKAAIDTARKKEVPTHSPMWFKRAETSFIKAQDLHREGEKVRDIFEYISLGQGQLKKANQMAQIANTTLKDVITVRKKAYAAGANNQTEGFREAEDEFIELTSAVEESLPGWVEKRRKEVISMYRSVELTAIKNNSLEAARSEFKKAEQKYEADDYAEKAFQAAKTEMQNAEQFITENRYDNQGIEKAASRAHFFARRASAIARYSKFIKDSEPEDVALWIEKNVHKLSKNFEMDLRNEFFSTQFTQLTNKLNAVEGAKRSLAGRSAELEIQLSTLKPKIDELEKERLFNRKFIKARRFFAKHEADVYKEGGKLIIRLKGIDFKSGKAVLESQNYALLSKVKGTLEEFNNAIVTVEGHTDSIGSAKANESLSSNRAQSVKEYLVANGAIENHKIESVGLGFSKPIASNKTKTGRSQNRRIDIIIYPSK